VKTKIPFKEHSLFFAPMEGVTDEAYRNVITTLYPEWDYICTDFLRIPTTGSYPDKHLVKHYGEKVYSTPELKQKTIYQILTSSTAFTEDHIQRINSLGIDWLDINLGCPSKTVCKNQGGSYLLSDHDNLRKIIKTIRQNFKGTFTAKIRVGYKDDLQFDSTLKLLEAEGVEAITIHARTRDQLYKGVAKWQYVKHAVNQVDIPIIGNGDIWTVSDIEDYFDYTGCHSVMIARGALKTPWLAREFHAGRKVEDPQMRMLEMLKYYKEFYKEMENMPKLNDLAKNRRLKSVSRYIFDPMPDSKDKKKKFLLSKDYNEMMDIVSNLI
jgi:tRNA-dihydrouridine synthase